MKEYRVQTLQKTGWNTALITMYRHEAETHNEKLCAWAKENEAALPGGGRVSLIAYINGQEDEIIRTNKPAPIPVGSREWEEDENGEPVRITPK